MQSGSERMGSMDAGKGPCLAARARSVLGYSFTKVCT